MQRRSLAPSQLSVSTSKRPSPSLNFKSPVLESNRKLRKCQESKKENEQITPRISVSEYEALIAKVLNRPFKVPIADYVSDGPAPCLGLRRSTFRRYKISIIF